MIKASLSSFYVRMAMFSLVDPYVDRVNLTSLGSKLPKHSVNPNFPILTWHLWQVLTLFGRNQVYEGKVLRAQTVFRQLNSDSEKDFKKHLYTPAKSD